MKAFVVYLGMVAFTLAIFFFAPQVDLATSGLFYDPERGFMLASWSPIVLLFHVIPWITGGTLVLAAVGASWLLLLGRPLWRLDRKALIFLVASTAAGPGLLANTLLKDHWGRARPTQIEAFGGTHHFTPAPLPAAECDRNCAFVSGHAALAFSLVSFAFLLPRGRSRFRSARRTGPYRARRSFSVGCRLCRPARLWHDGAALLVDRRLRRSHGAAAPPILSVDLARCGRRMGHRTSRSWVARHSPRFCCGRNDASRGDLDRCRRPAARIVLPRPRPRPALALRLHRASRFDLRLFDHLRPCFRRAALGRRTAPTAAVRTAAARPVGNSGVPLPFDCRLGRHR